MENVYRFMQAIRDQDASKAANVSENESVVGGYAWLMVTTALVDIERRITQIELAKRYIDTLK